MLKLSKKVDYGLVVLAALCRSPKPASARELAENYHLPSPMVAGVLKQLAAGGVLTSTRGAQGGYKLARDPRRINLADIVEALEGAFSLVECIDETCAHQAHCPTQDPLQVVQQKFMSFMTGLSLAEIMAHAQGVWSPDFELGAENSAKQV